MNISKLEQLMERGVHQKRSERFYSLKKAYRKRSMKSSTMEAITMDFLKKLPCPNITTNDVYYRRQLNFISFNIHVLSTQQAVFYTYDESVTKKGADDVCSMFRHFVFNILPLDVRELCIFCDSCEAKIRIIPSSGFYTIWLQGKNVLKPLKSYSR